jgi:hypothetical protein
MTETVVAVLTSTGDSFVPTTSFTNRKPWSARRKLAPLTVTTVLGAAESETSFPASSKNGA